MIITFNEYLNKKDKIYLEKLENFKGISFLINPIKTELINFINKIKEKRQYVSDIVARGMVFNDDILCWDAYNHTHQDIARLIGAREFVPLYIKLTRSQRILVQSDDPFFTHPKVEKIQF